MSAWPVRAAALAFVLGGCGSPPPLVEADVRNDLRVELNHRAARAVARGELARAIALYREALRLSVALEDFHGAAVNALSLAAVLQAAGDYAQADQALDAVLAMPARHEPRFVAAAAGRRASIALQQRRLRDAEDWLARAENACPQPGCALEVALANIRAQVLLESGAPGEAQPLLERALAQSRAAGDREEEANALRLLGRVSAAQGDPAAGAALVLRALETDKQLTRPAKIALDLLLLAGMALQEGRREDAHEYALRSFNVSRAVRSREGQEAARAMMEKTR